VHSRPPDGERDFAPAFPPKTYSTPAFDGNLPSSHYEMILARSMHLSQRREEGDKLDFRMRADFPVTVISKNYDSGETTTDTWTNSFQDSGEANYDYRMATQSMRPEPVSGVYGTGVILPEINLGRHTVDLEIERKPVELTLSATPGKGNTIRFNNKILVDGVDRSKLFKVHRLERDWFLMEDPTGVHQGWEMVNDWRDVTDDGNLSAERDVSFDSFFPPKSPRSAWGDRLYAAEFLDAVERFPELGFLYHVVALVTNEKGAPPMEIVVLSPEKMDADRWCELFQREKFREQDLKGLEELTKKNFR
jgi:hypothetical protein